MTLRITCCSAGCNEVGSDEYLLSSKLNTPTQFGSIRTPDGVEFDWSTQLSRAYCYVVKRNVRNLRDTSSQSLV